MVENLSFLEAHDTQLLAAVEKGSEWDVVIIEEGLSRNRNFYSEEVLRSAIPLFEGCRACAFRFGDRISGDKFDHLPDTARNARPSGFAENVVGWFENVRFDDFTRPNGTTGRGLRARFHILEGQDQIRKGLLDAWNHGRADLLGFSIDAGGKARNEMLNGQPVKWVEKIATVVSTDMVTEPAAGGSILRLVASFQGGGTVNDLIGLVRQHRLPWFEGFANPDEGVDLQDYAIRMLEANLVQAEEVLKEIPADEVSNLAEVARGVKALNSVIVLIRGGKTEEAVKMLENWISVHPMQEKGDAAAQRRGCYSFPYSAQQAGSPGAVVPPDRRESTMAPTIETTGAPAGTTDPQPAPVSPPAPAPAATPAPARDPEAEKRTEELAVREAEMKVRDDEAKQRDTDLRVREAKLVISEKLSESTLPATARDRVRESLVAKAQQGEIKDDEIVAAIKNEEDYIKSFTEAAPAATVPTPTVASTPVSTGRPTGLGDAHTDSADAKITQDKFEKVGKAWDGFFNGDASPVDGVPAFTSLHEAFGQITGRWYSPEDMASLIFESISKALPGSPNRRPEDHFTRMRETWATLPQSDLFREAVTTSDFSVAFGDSLFRRLQKTYREDPRNDWRRIVSSIENLTDATNTFNLVRIGAVGSLPVVNQNAPYQEFTDPTEVNETLTPSKRGALLKFTWEDALADRIGVLRRIPDNLARASVRTIHELVWDQIDTNPAMADANLLISTANSNVLSGAGVLSYANLTTLIQQLRNQTEQDSGKKLGLSPMFLLVGPTKENEAVEITDSSVKVNAAEDATVRSFVNKLGIQTFATLGLGRSTSPDTQFRYYLAASPRDAETIVVGFLGGRDRPDIFVQSPVDTPTSGAAFDADAMTFKVRLVVGARVADHRWIQGSLATA